MDAQTTIQKFFPDMNFKFKYPKRVKRILKQTNLQVFNEKKET